MHSINKLSVYFKRIFIASLIITVGNTVVYAQKEFDGIRGTHKWMMFSDAPNSLYHHLADQAYSFLNKRSDHIATYRTLAEWQQRQKWIRTTLIDMLGPFPEKTPLKANITKVINKVDYKVENLVYESQPGFYVTASLFIPTTQKGKKMPAIIYCSGHSESGYRTSSYRRTILNLVK